MITMEVFVIDKDPEKGSAELLRCLDYCSLASKSKETVAIPLEHNVPMSLWVKRLLEILNQSSRADRRLCQLEKD